MDNMNKIDNLLKSRGPVVPLRHDLAAQTLMLVGEARRIRRIKRLLAGLLALTAALLIAKWLQNDVLYLMQLAITKFHLVRAQSGLYLGAAWEALPKAQAATLIVIAALWLGWRKFETLLLGSN